METTFSKLCIIVLLPTRNTPRKLRCENICETQSISDSHQKIFDVLLRPKLSKAIEVLRFKMLCIQKLIEDTLSCLWLKLPIVVEPRPQTNIYSKIIEITFEEKRWIFHKK